MTESPDSRRAPAERVDDLTAILHSMRQAVHEALLQHKRAGNPLAVWQDEQVVWIQPEDIPTEWHDDPAGIDPLCPGSERLD